MKKILFVCHGNICRSPMAEFVFKEMLRKNGLEKDFIVNSAATSTEEIGNGIHPGTRRILQKNKIPFTEHHAIQMTKSDYEEYDLLIGMDQNNIRNMLRLTNGDSKNKIRLMMEFCNKTRDVADPWYTGNFEQTYIDIEEACEGLLAYVG